jgi:hypothetical protein
VLPDAVVVQESRQPAQERNLHRHHHQQQQQQQHGEVDEQQQERQQHHLESEEAGEVQPSALPNHFEAEDEAHEQHPGLLDPAAATADAPDALQASPRSHQQPGSLHSQEQQEGEEPAAQPVDDQQQEAPAVLQQQQQQEQQQTAFLRFSTPSQDASWGDPVDIGLAAAAEAEAAAAAGDTAAADAGVLACDMQVDPASPHAQGGSSSIVHAAGLAAVEGHDAAETTKQSQESTADGAAAAAASDALQLPPPPDVPTAMDVEATEPAAAATSEQLPPPPPVQQQQQEAAPAAASAAADVAADAAASEAAAAVEAGAGAHEDGPRKRRRMGFGQGLARLAMQPGAAGAAAGAAGAAAAAAAEADSAASAPQQGQLQPQGSLQPPGDAAAAQQQQQPQAPALNKADISRALSRLEDQVTDLEQQLKDLEGPADILTSKLAAAHQQVVQLENKDLMAAARQDLEAWLSEERQRRREERDIVRHQQRREQQEREQQEDAQKQQERQAQEAELQQQREHARRERQQRRLEQEANRSRLAVAVAALRARPPESAGIILPLSHAPAAASAAASAARLQGAAALHDANRAPGTPPAGAQLWSSTPPPPAAAAAAAAAAGKGQAGNYQQLRQHWRSSERDDIVRSALVNINTSKARAARLELAKLLPDSMQEEAQQQLAAAQPLKQQYKLPDELPQHVKDLQERSKAARPGIRRFLAQRSVLLHAKQAALADRYKKGVASFTDHLKKVSEAATAAAAVAAAGHGSGRGASGSYGGAFGGVGSRLTRASAAYADPYQSAVLRSAHDEQQVSVLRFDQGVRLAGCFMPMLGLGVGVGTHVEVLRTDCKVCSAVLSLKSCVCAVVAQAGL